MINLIIKMMCLVKTSYDQIKYIGRKKGLNKSRPPCYKKKLIEIKVDAYDISKISNRYCMQKLPIDE